MENFSQLFPTPAMELILGILLIKLEFERHGTKRKPTRLRRNGMEKIRLRKAIRVIWFQIVARAFQVVGRTAEIAGHREARWGQHAKQEGHSSWPPCQQSECWKEVINKQTHRIGGIKQSALMHYAWCLPANAFCQRESKRRLTPERRCGGKIGETYSHILPVTLGCLQEKERGKQVAQILCGGCFHPCPSTQRK